MTEKQDRISPKRPRGGASKLKKQQCPKCGREHTVNERCVDRNETQILKVASDIHVMAEGGKLESLAVIAVEVGGETTYASFAGKDVIRLLGAVSVLRSRIERKMIDV